LINCDWFNPAADRKVNVTDLSPFEDGTVDYIECHHTIEHLSFDEADIAFREWARVLKPGGYAVITCPDFQGLIRRWRTSSRTENWSHTIQMFYGSQEHAGMFHRSGYDRAELSSRLAKCGLAAQFAYTPYPRRPTPSLLVIAAKL
jgi:predicted SAM-dependent methyltransferase